MDRVADLGPLGRRLLSGTVVCTGLVAPPLSDVRDRPTHCPIGGYAVRLTDAEDAKPPVALGLGEPQEAQALGRAREVLEPRGPVGADAHGGGQQVHVLDSAGHSRHLLVVGEEPLALLRLLPAHADGDQVRAPEPLLAPLLRDVGLELLDRGELAAPGLGPEGRVARGIEAQRRVHELLAACSAEHDEAPRLGLPVRGGPAGGVEQLPHLGVAHGRARVVLREDGPPGLDQSPDGVHGEVGASLTRCVDGALVGCAQHVHRRSNCGKVQLAWRLPEELQHYAAFLTKSLHLLLAAVQDLTQSMQDSLAHAVGAAHVHEAARG